MKKRIGILAVVVAGILVILLLFGGGSQKVRLAPSFVSGTPPGIETNRWVWAMYSWSDPAPFQDGKIWLWTTSGRTNIRTFRFDLDSGKIVGELFTGGAVFCNEAQTKLLCAGPEPAFSTMKNRVSEWLKKVSNGSISFQPNRVETIWLLDLKSNMAKRMGELSQLQGAGSRWTPAPGFRFAYNEPSTASAGEFFLFDFESESMTKLASRGEIQGWWDARNLLVKDRMTNFVAFDVTTQSNRIVFSAEATRLFLKQSGTANDGGLLRARPVWNGSNYLFYFSNPTNSVAGHSFLVKADAANPAYEMVVRDFHFEWAGRFDPTFTLYLVSGESGQPGQGGNGTVYLRDLKNGTTKTLVEPDNKGYALARFYKDKAIYVRDRQIWRVDLDGSHQLRLFPPPENETQKDLELR